jgi:hypothetical protein
LTKNGLILSDIEQQRHIDGKDRVICNNLMESPDYRESLIEFMNKLRDATNNKRVVMGIKQS